MQSNASVYVIVPAFNESKYIGKFLEDLDSLNGHYKILFIDDGSNDFTYQILKRNGWDVLRHQVNLGQWAALKTGFIIALHEGADIIVTLDSDGQHLPQDIPRLVFPIIEDEMDFVIGSRFMDDENNMVMYRNYGIRLFNTILRIITGYKLTDCTNGFRAVKSELIKKVINDLSENQYGSLEYLIKTSRYKPQITEVSIAEISSEKSSKGSIKYGMNLVRSIIDSL